MHVVTRAHKTLDLGKNQDWGRFHFQLSYSSQAILVSLSLSLSLLAVPPLKADEAGFGQDVVVYVYIYVQWHFEYTSAWLAWRDDRDGDRGQVL